MIRHTVPSAWPSVVTISELTCREIRMKQGKTKYTRQDAERLFEGLSGSVATASRRTANPFGDDVLPDAQRSEKKATLWKENLITLPMGIELPAGYESASLLRKAMTQALGVRWVREDANEVIAEFPDGWLAIRPPSGPIELRDPRGAVRALYGWARDAELRLLPRYWIESQSNSSSGLGSLVVRDRANGQILERSATWSAQTGINHPDWTRLLAWLDSRFANHHDPLRYWDDCEIDS